MSSASSSPSVDSVPVTPLSSAHVVAASTGTAPVGGTIESLQFDNLAIRTLPIDKEERNFVREVPDACFSFVDPTPVLNPQLVCYSADALDLIDLNVSEVARPDFVEYFSGNRLLPGARPAAHTYCGHQFGYFSGQLGDGATMYLGEIINSKKERIELQFKGAGLTPYSRTADGRKVLRSSMREFLCSEAHHYLGIPTTRAGTIVTSDTLVTRDILYDGNPIDERATIITRLAPTFLRFGSFEIAKGVDSMTGRAGPSPGRHDLIQRMVDYVIATFYQDVIVDCKSSEERYLAFFRELTQRTAILVAKWQTFGWCHGVLNTDNMSIIGLTIDYGPFGFMESFDPEYICNGSDTEGRYRYEAQPEICGWNLLKLSQTFETFVTKEKMRDIIGEFEGMYEKAYNEINRRKLGVGMFKTPVTAAAAAASAPGSSSAEDAAMRPASASNDDSDGETDANALYTQLAADFYSTMAETGSDFTNSFRCLSRFNPNDVTSFESVLTDLTSHCASLTMKLATVAPRLPARQLAMIESMMSTNPELFERPGMEEQRAIVYEELRRKSRREELNRQTPEEKLQEDRKIWKIWLQQYGEVLKKEMRIGNEGGHTESEMLEMRRRLQNSNNPKYILRNWIAQEVIAAAEKGDYQPTRDCLERLKDPFDIDDRSSEQSTQFASAASASSNPAGATHDDSNMQPQPGATCPFSLDKKRPDWANHLKVTCSS